MKNFKTVLEHFKTTWENHPQIPPGVARDIEVILRSNEDPVAHTRRIISLWRDIGSRVSRTERTGLYEAARTLDAAITEFLTSP